MRDMAGRVALVTGAAGSLGRATAQAFAAAGASVIAADIRSAAGKETVELILDSGGSAMFVECDVTREDSVREMVRAGVDAFGGLDFAYNNGHIDGFRAPISGMTDGEFRRVMDVNLFGTFYCMKHEIPVMIRGGGGAIVNTSSGAGVIGVPNQADYVAAKHGVIGLTKSAALENITKNVRINSICPGTARSRMVDGWLQGSLEAEQQVAALHPIGRIAEPEEIARAVCWLLSDDASFVVGATISADGGYTVP